MFVELTLASACMNSVMSIGVRVAEVRTSSTEAIDRTEKLEEYRVLPSVEDYVLVSSERQAVEAHHRDR